MYRRLPLRATAAGRPYGRLPLVSEVLGFLLGDAWQRRRSSRRALEQLESAGTVDSGLRVVSGAVAGLTREWKHGSWAVEPGKLSLFSTVVDVMEVEDGHRQPSARESWGVNPDADIVTLRCPSGRVEWALLPSCRAEATRRLKGSHRDRVGGRAQA
jgi:hypothetical protein